MTCERCGRWVTEGWTVTIRKADRYGQEPSILNKGICRKCAEALKEKFCEDQEPRRA